MEHSLSYSHKYLYVFLHIIFHLPSPLGCPREEQLLRKKEDKDKNNLERKEEWLREAKMAKNKLDG